MINNISTASSFNTFHDNINDKSQLNDCIEIDEEITNFEMLHKQKNFSLIRSKYAESIKELAKLYYFFEGKQVTQSVQFTIETIYSTEITKHNSLFYSYKKTRRYISSIIDYLNLCKNKQIRNNHTAMIAAKLSECFGFCLEGFNSKITDLHDYIVIYSNSDLDKKINTKIKKLIQETIRDVLLAKQNNHDINISTSNIHYQNAFFNLIADDFNFKIIVDKYATLNNIKFNSVTDIVKEVKIKVSKFNICKYISNYLYDIFKDCLTEIGKVKWLDGSVYDLKNEDISILEHKFLFPINKYLCSTAEENILKISDIFLENDDLSGFCLADVKDVLHYFIARYNNNIVKNSLNKHKYNNLIIALDNNAYIYNIYDSYFYVLHNTVKQPITLDYMLNIGLDDIDINGYISMFIQALTNTEENRIHDFFNKENTNQIIFNTKGSKYIISELKRFIKNNKYEQEKLLNGITSPYIEQKHTSYKLLYQFITKSILVCEITEILFNYNIDINNLFHELNKKEKYDFILKLSEKNTLILKMLSYYKDSSNITSIIYNILYINIGNEESYQIIKDFDITTTNNFLSCMNTTKRSKLLARILNKNNYKLAKLFIEMFLCLEIVDENKNSILHHIAKNKDEKSLTEVIELLDNTSMKTLQLKKNNKGETALMVAIKQENNYNIIATLLKKNNTVNLQNCYGNTALSLCVLSNKLEYLNLILDYCDNTTINIKNNNGSNSLMIAANVGYLDCITALLKRINYRKYLYETNKNNNNSLSLALKYKHDDCGVFLIEKYNAEIIMEKNIDGYNALMLAAKNNLILSLKQILAKCNRDMIIKAIIKATNNSLMLSIIHKNHLCTKELLKIFTVADLNHTNDKKENALSLAIIYNSDYLEDIISLSTVKQIQNVTAYGYNALSLACHHGIDSKLMLDLIKKNGNKVTSRERGYMFPLLNAVKQGHVHCLDVLSKYITEKNIINTKNANDDNCLAIAIKNNYYNCVEYMLKNYPQSAIKTLLSTKVKNLSVNTRMKKIINSYDNHNA
jgi:ankyrin repeat protein